jgi:hypothetical protein
MIARPLSKIVVFSKPLSAEKLRLGRTNSHLYEIRARNVGWGIPGAGWGDGPLDVRKARLIDVIEDVGTKTPTTDITLSLPRTRFGHIDDLGSSQHARTS